MCGIAGFITPGGGPADELECLGSAMTDALLHRGPDDAGVWVDPGCGAVLGNRRLSVLDLSSSAHQPMHSADGRYVLVLNGEVYNFRELREALEKEGHAFRGSGDTEVFAEAVACWGFDGCLPKLNGMFAAAVWDREERCLFLARDRFGEKPLYYGQQKDTFLFGSELKALREHPSFEGAVDPDGAALYLDLGCIPSPGSIYKGIKKLPPASWIKVDADGSCSEPVAFWSASWPTEPGSNKASEEELVEELEHLLSASLEARLVSDRPLGSFLSGGIDSSLLVSLLRKKLGVDQETFCIGFEDAAFNEAEQARKVADCMGTRHEELVCTESDARRMRDQLTRVYDEPFADSSQLAMMLVSELASSSVTVCLSGDGGDELFAGYYRYQWAGFSKQLNRLPAPLRAAMRKAAGLAGGSRKLAETLSSMLPSGMRSPRPLEKMEKLADLLHAGSLFEQYVLLVSVGAGLAAEPASAAYLENCWQDQGSEVAGMQAADLRWYLPGDLLVKADRSSMAVSLETRAPFLDPDVFSFAAKVSNDWKIRKGEGKYILRSLLRKHLPEDLVKTNKQGFEVPIHHWLQGPWKAWGEELMADVLPGVPVAINRDRLAEAWKNLQAGQAGERHRVWNALVLLDWFRTWHG